MMIGMKGLGEIPEMQTQPAFRKGVEWFTEFVFFYGMCFSIVFYEIGKNMKASKKVQQRINKVYENNDKWDLNSD